LHLVEEGRALRGRRHLIERVSAGDGAGCGADLVVEGEEHGDEHSRFECAPLAAPLFQAAGQTCTGEARMFTGFAAEP
jgi:hypothetical protein